MTIRSNRLKFTRFTEEQKKKLTDLKWRTENSAADWLWKLWTDIFYSHMHSYIIVYGFHIQCLVEHHVTCCLYTTNRHTCNDQEFSLWSPLNLNSNPTCPTAVWSCTCDQDVRASFAFLRTIIQWPTAAGSHQGFREKSRSWSTNQLFLSLECRLSESPGCLASVL